MRIVNSLLFVTISRMSCTPLVWVVEQFSLEFTSMLILSLSCYDQNSISILMCGHFSSYSIPFLSGRVVKLFA